MAYDPNDPKDKEIVDGLIAAALEEQIEEHGNEVKRLTDKNTELLGKLRKARTDAGGDNKDEIERLERELEETRHDLNESQSKFRIADRDLKKVTSERDNAVTERDSERNFSRNQLVENSLNGALIEAKVAPHFMDAAKALLKEKVAVEVEGDERKVVADGKSVGEFVKEWAAGDAGKHYVTAPANGGGGANGANGGGSPGGKALADLTEAERVDMAKNRPEEWKQVQLAAGISSDNPAIIQ